MIIEKKKISELKPAPYNPRIDVKENKYFYEKLYRSIKQFGLVEPIIWNKRTGHVVGGNQRLQILKDDGVEEVDVVVVDLPLEEEKALNIALNKITGDWDKEKLADLLNELNTIDDFLTQLTGFDEKELNQIIDSHRDVQEDDFDVDAALEHEPKYRIKCGDIYQLGNHRLMCGDATNPDDVKWLMDGRKADMVFTDPPYGLNIVDTSQILQGKRKGMPEGKLGFDKEPSFKTTGRVGFKHKVKANIYRPVIGDDKPFDPTPILQLDVPKMILFGANNYASKLPDNSHWIVWDKHAHITKLDHTFFGEAELLWTNIPKKSVRIYRYLWKGLLREGDRKTELEHRIHPTQKPVGLLVNILKDYSKQNEIILDPFGGSGSTLIACEQLNRICYMMEIDPIYCSVIIERWEKLTGKKAEYVGNYGS